MLHKIKTVVKTPDFAKMFIQNPLVYSSKCIFPALPDCLKTDGVRGFSPADLTGRAAGASRKERRGEGRGKEAALCSDKFSLKMQEMPYIGL